MLRTWPLVLLTAGVLALAACEDAQEVLPSTSATVEPSAAASVSPSPTLSPSATQTPIPCPTGDCSRIAMYMEGPAQAKPGELLTYILHYDVRQPGGASVVVSFPNYVEYVSSKLTLGTGTVTSEPAPDRPGLWWALQPGTGTLEITLKAPTDLSTGKFNVGAYETGTNATQSNSIETTLATPSQ